MFIGGSLHQTVRFSLGSKRRLTMYSAALISAPSAAFTRAAETWTTSREVGAAAFLCS
jgi:hypothetical protein